MSTANNKKRGVPHVLPYPFCILPLLSRFRVMYLNEYEFSQFYEIAVKKLLAILVRTHDSKGFALILLWEPFLLKKSSVHPDPL